MGAKSSDTRTIPGTFHTQCCHTTEGSVACTCMCLGRPPHTDTPRLSEALWKYMHTYATGFLTLMESSTLLRFSKMYLLLLLVKFYFSVANSGAHGAWGLSWVLPLPW